MGVKVITGGKEAFDKALAEAGSKLVVVDFYADWCGPCKHIAPKIEEFSNAYTDVVFTKVNVDDESEIAESCKISAMPTFIFYKNGQKVHSITGAAEAKVKEAIEKNK